MPVSSDVCNGPVPQVRILSQSVSALSTEFHTYSLKNKKAGDVGSHPHSSTLAWKVPWTEEPGELRPMGLQRVGHD